MNAPTTLAGRVDAVVIGASAGGIEALSVLLPALPARMRAAVFVVVHLPRERPSLLVDIYSARCRVGLREGEDKAPVEPGVVVFAPPDYHLLVDAGPQVALSADAPVHYSRPSIDVLFESAADFYAERLLGIVLSGANDDGAAGLAAVHAAGGLAVVQDPAEALSATMPAAALRRVEGASALRLDAIAALLATLDRGAEPTEGRR